MKQGCIAACLLLISLIGQAQSTYIADSTILMANQSFFKKQGIELSGYDFHQKESTAELNKALHYRTMRNSNYKKAAIAGGISAVVFTVMAIHLQKEERESEYTYESYTWITDLFLGMTGGSMALTSACFAISGLSKEAKMQKALRRSDQYLIKD